MQYVSYEYAKENKVIGLVLWQWMKLTPGISLRARGGAIKSWRENKCLLQIGERLPKSSLPETIEQWTKEQNNPDYHRDQYLRKYLEKNLLDL